VSVVGGSDEDPETLARAEQVGVRLADRGHVVVCGGLGGVMAAACRGAHEADGTTVGILPGEDPADANPHVTVPVATGLGHARNALVVLNGVAVVAVGGAAGTLSELGYAGVFDRPVAGLDTHDVPWVRPTETAQEAVAYVEEAAGDRRE
jgi:hypothetical protein